MKFNFFVLAIAFLLFCTCKKGTISTFDCSSIPATYTINAKPILDEKCATSGCHNATTKAEGYDYSSYEAAKSKAKEKAFLGSKQHVSGFEKMPHHGSKLSETEIKTLSCWVQNDTPL